MNNSQVAQAFAYGKTDGKGSNMFIDGDTIYSYGYHFPIARHTKYVDEKGREIVFFTSRNYSNSTSKHKHHVLNALSGFRVIECDISRHGVTPEAIQSIEKEIEELQKKEKRARKEHIKNMYASDIKQKRADIETLKCIVSSTPEQATEEENPFKAMVMVAKIGELMTDNIKDANEWKVRMMKAGLPEDSIQLPDDWDTLSEEEKKNRLDQALSILGDK